MPKSVSCPLCPKSAISVRVFPTWWPAVRSKHSSSIPPRVLREPQGGMRKRNKSRPRSLKTEGKHKVFPLWCCFQETLPQVLVIERQNGSNVSLSGALTVVTTLEKLFLIFLPVLLLLFFCSALDKCLSFGKKQSDVVAADINPCLGRCAPPSVEPFNSV